MLLDWQVRRAIRLYRDGMSMGDVARELGLRKERVRRALHQSGAVEIRRRGRPKGWSPAPTVAPADAAVRRATLRQIAEWDRRQAIARDAR